MSSQDQGQPGRAERPRSFTRFIRRASKAMRPKERASEESSAAPPTAAAARGAAPGPSAAATPAASRPTATTNPTAAIAGQAAAPKSARPSSPGGPQIVRSTPTSAAAHFRKQEEKARGLFAKYNMQLEAGEWTRTRGPSAETEWVEKKVRIRVHRQCHRCQTPYGTTRTCATCSHERCKKCPRFPDKSLADPGAKSGGTGVAVDPDPKFQAIARRNKAPMLTMVGKHGTELRWKPQQQRVRRNCHKCDALFQGKATVCANCQHPRCPKCPREPAKPNKYPDGYPGDTEELFPLAERTFRQTRRRVRWTCHECSNLFRDNEHECRSCKHTRCDACTREPPKKQPKPPPDESVVRALEERLARVALRGAA